METHGEIIKIIRNRGFGFIKAENQENEIFFHHSNILNAQFDDLTEGSNVVFNLTETSKGFEAVDISIIQSNTNVDEDIVHDETL